MDSRENIHTYEHIYIYIRLCVYIHICVYIIKYYEVELTKWTVERELGLEVGDCGVEMM